MSRSQRAALQFQPFRPDLDPGATVMIDGHAPGFRMISHWPGHDTPGPLRHDLTTGSAFLFAELDAPRRRELLGDFSIVTNNHYDADGALSLFTMLRPAVAARHRDLMLRAARAGDFAVFGGADALALELGIMSDLGAFVPFSTPPFDAERLGNLSKAYLQVFDRMEALLADPFAFRDRFAKRYDTVIADIARIEAGEGVSVTAFEDEDLAVVESDRPITIYGLRLAAGERFRVLLVHPRPDGSRYRFCFRGESWWDVVSVRPKPRIALAPLAERLNRLESTKPGRWWATPSDWVVPELGFGDPVALHVQAARFDPQIQRDPPSSLPVEGVVQELRQAFRREQPVVPGSAFAERDAGADVA